MKTFKKACVFIGMVVGAGFASGREITDYFLVFGQRWKAGVIFSGVLFFLTFAAVTDIISRNGIHTYKEYLNTVMGEKAAVFTEWVSGLFFFVMFFAMTSAAGSAAREMLVLDFKIGAAALLLICAVVMLKGMEAIETVSILLVPLLIIGIWFIGEKAGTGESLINNGGSVILSALIYVSYNTISSASVLVQAERFESRFDSVLTGVICGTAMTVMGLMIGKAVLSGGAAAVSAELPFAVVAGGLGGVCFAVYGAVFMASVLTTAICDGMAAKAFIEEKTGMRSTASTAVLIGLAAIFSAVSFSDFVSKIYPLFGIAGVIQLFCTLMY
ncbi:MAG: hypothetical protein LUE88_04445, partial [Clostridiales bacterium]|nr:hypothetical protein [Clostridiales bacterium]